jgi:hypothetical protein
VNSGSFEPAHAGLSLCRRVSPSPFPVELFHRSWADYGTSRNKQKTFHRFSGTISFGGVGLLLVVGGQWLATEKIPKNRKNAKKSAKYFPWDPGFSAKTGGF